MDKNSPERKIHTDKIKKSLDIVHKLQITKFPNYLDFLSITPISKRDDIPIYYDLKKNFLSNHIPQDISLQERFYAERLLNMMRNKNIHFIIDEETDFIFYDKNKISCINIKKIPQNIQNNFLKNTYNQDLMVSTNFEETYKYLLSL
jgi:hypothetical protein